MTCFNSADGMGQCLRGKMTDAGILPQTSTTATAPAEQAPAGEVAVVDPSAETAVGEPALDVTPPAPDITPEQIDSLIAATFGLRVEPDGSVLIAGTGTPGTELEVYSNDELLGTAEVEATGDWVLLPEQPLAPGGSEITLAEVGKEGRAERSYVVVISDDKTSEPLVVASTPGAASEVLQGLDTPAPTTDRQLAAADPVAPAARTPTPAPPAAVEAPVTPEAATSAPAEPTPADSAPASPATAVTQPAPDAVEPPPAAEPEPAPAPPPTTVASADPAPSTPAPRPQPATASIPPTIDAIEIEGQRTFFAGAGPEGATVRLYVDDSYIADSTVADGRWLVEADNVLTKPQQRVRIDLLEAGSADVAARAEVNFVVELPSETAPTTVAEAPAATPPAAVPSQSPATPSAPASATVTSPVAPAATPAPAAEPAPAPAPEPVVAPDPAAPTPGPVVPPVTGLAQEPTAAPPAATPPPVIPAEPPPVAAATTDPVAPAAASTGTSPTASPDSAIPTMVAVAVGGPDAERFASGKAIIRRGDNLWTIARRVYGEGIRYTTIYEANTGQIRDPDRIYPGQVFELPN